MTVKSLFIAGVFLAVTRPANSGVFYKGWAGDFLVGEITCKTNEAGMGCSIKPYWSGPYWIHPDVNDYVAPPTWSYVGQQTFAGRANSQAKVMTRFFESDSLASYALTVTLNRFRANHIIGGDPVGGEPCSVLTTSTGGSHVGSVSRTISTLGLQPADWKHESRLLPMMNFSAEPASSGSHPVFYKDNISGSLGGGASSNKDTCYKLYWYF
jgi:hypothetical protein